MKAAITCAFAVLLLLPYWAFGQGYPYPCVPLIARAASATGSSVEFSANLHGVAYGYWCPVAPADCTGNTTNKCWKPYIWAGLYAYYTDANKKLVSDLDKTPVASLPSAIASAVAAGKVDLAPGSKEECRHAQLLRAVCVKLRSPPYAGVPFQQSSVEKCPAEKDCEALVTPERWVVSKSGASITRQAYLLTSGSKGAANGQAAVGATCDCSVKLEEGFFPFLKVTYCKVPATAVTGGTPTDHITSCTRAPQ